MEKSNGRFTSYNYLNDSPTLKKTHPTLFAEISKNNQGLDLETLKYNEAKSINWVCMSCKEDFNKMVALKEVQGVCPTCKELGKKHPVKNKRKKKPVQPAYITDTTTERTIKVTIEADTLTKEWIEFAGITDKDQQQKIATLLSYVKPTEKGRPIVAEQAKSGKKKSGRGLAKRLGLCPMFVSRVKRKYNVT